MSSVKNNGLDENEDDQSAQDITSPHESRGKWSKKRHRSSSVANTKSSQDDISSAATALASSSDSPRMLGSGKNAKGSARRCELLKYGHDGENRSRANNIIGVVATSANSPFLDQPHVSHEPKKPRLASIIIRSDRRPRRKLLILDVNGLLADILQTPEGGYKPDTWISRKAVFKRPFCDDFLHFCFQNFDVGIWSSRTRWNVEGVINFLMGRRKMELLFCWNQEHCTNTGYNTIGSNSKPLFLKEIKKLWDKEEPDLPWDKGDYNESNTLLIDDSPYKALRNPPYTGIFPEPYSYKNIRDKSLGPHGDLRLYLERLVAAENVQKFVKENMIGQRPITKSNLSWVFYSKIINGANASEPEKKGNGRPCKQESNVTQEPIRKGSDSRVAISIEDAKDVASSSVEVDRIEQRASSKKCKL